MRTASSLVLATTVITVTACGGDYRPRHQAPDYAALATRARQQYGLSTTGTCEDLARAVLARELRAMDAILDANLEYALKMRSNSEEYCEQYERSSCGGGFLSFGSECDMVMAARAGGGGPETGGGGASAYTTTNNQVGGVDEPDFIKNDANQLYMVAGQAVEVVKAWPAQEAEVLSSSLVDGNPENIFVDRNRLVVFSRVGSATCQYDALRGSYYSGDGLTVTVLDISDAQAPVLERKIHVDGHYVSARYIDGVVHLVAAADGIDGMPGFSTWPGNLSTNLCEGGDSKKKIRAKFEELRQQNRARLLEAAPSIRMPAVHDVDYLAGEMLTTRSDVLGDCANVMVPEVGTADGLLTFLSFPIDDDATLGASSMVGRFGEVYATHDNLYVAVGFGGGGWGWRGGWGGESSTIVHKLALRADAGPAIHQASGAVDGYIINQFAMDEYEGNLRIATTEGQRWWGADSTLSNNVFILAPNGSGTLETVGQIRDIAPNEDIRAVRFDGPRGFVVTFEKTDPLFTFDLSDPANPRTLGELEIPGFSTYIHFMDPNHLLTIGYDAQDMGDFSWFQGVILQIFDVTDMTNPRLTHKELIGTRGSSSEATANHLAFTYFRERNLLALPMAVCEGGGSDGIYGDRMTFDGLMVYRVSTDSGFESLGGVDHRDGTSYNGDCYNWWQTPDSRVKRSFFMEDFVYSVSNDHLKINHIDSLDVDVRSLNIPGAGQTVQYESCYGW